MLRPLVPLLLLLAATLPATARSQVPLSAFGADGELIEVLAGRYADLFGERTDALPDSEVLALEITAPGAAPERLLIPGTENEAPDQAWALVGDAEQQFVLWSTRNTFGESVFQLVGFDGESWTDLIEISGDPTPRKSPPRLSITRDAYGSSVLSAPRTVVHLLWWEDDRGEAVARYTPVIFVGGSYLGWNPVVDLGAFDGNQAATESLGSDELYRAADLDSGADVRSVVVALPRQRSGRLLTMQMRVLPEPLLKLADEIRARIVLIGRAADGRGSMLRLADEIRARIVLIGRMHQGVREYVADKAYAALLSYGVSYVPEEAQQVADLGWLSVIQAGASILGNGLRDTSLPCSILYLGGDPTQMVGSRHQVEICLTSDRPVPETEPGREHTIFVSESGEEALVAWEGEDGALHFRESDGEGWGDAQTVNVGGLTSREKALRILRQSVRLQ
ncbi:MAG TPA: hypothetical protein VMV46_16135 [Thermoanaerobaculia bacterium]|nr:hypothetical protein [Thermoanaerobaculia bacterium]